MLTDMRQFIKDFIRRFIRQKQAGGICSLRLQASFTVEAAVVMNIVLLTLVSLILRCFTLHDEVMAKSTLLEALECYTHRNTEAEEESSWTDADKTEKISPDEISYFRILPSEIEISDKLTELRPSAKIDWNGESYKVDSSHLAMETIMRLAAVKDGLDEKKETVEAEGDENLREGNP